MNSTSGYLNAIFPPQQRAFPRRTNQDMIGMLSNHFMFFPHLQCDCGRAIDSPLGILKMQTFKKLPMQAPMQNVHICIIIGNSCAV